MGGFRERKAKGKSNYRLYYNLKVKEYFHVKRNNMKLHRMFYCYVLHAVFMKLSIIVGCY